MAVSHWGSPGTGFKDAILVFPKKKKNVQEELERF